MIISILCGVMLLCAMALTTVTAHADGGTITVNYPETAKAGFSTDFKVYKVGHFENGNDLVWDKEFSGLGLPNVSEGQFSGDSKMDDWAAALADAAYKLQEAIDSPDSSITVEPKTCTVGPNSGSVTVLENGLYLILGPREVANEDGTLVGYEPVPALVTIFTGSAEVTVKPTRDRVKLYQIRKIWGEEAEDGSGEAAADPIEEALRPDKIKLKISSRDSAEESFQSAESLNVVKKNEAGETIIEKVPAKDGFFSLEKSDNWSIIWEPDSIEQEWMCEEVLEPIDQSHYRSTQVRKVITNGTVMQITLKNKYDTEELELIKTIPAFIDHNVEGSGGQSATTIIFNVKGYIGETKVFERNESVIFDGPGTQKVTSKIPVNLTKLVVKEAYTANYSAEESDEITLTPEDLKNGVYTAEFKNKWDSTITPDGGIINQYTAPEDGPNYEDTNGGFTYIKQIIAPGKPK
ncbi:MAG: hypothetical protein IJ109_07540 [Firmicutes bacterium]|nr:hypothetical protein [Bacillota bacterium]